MPSSASLDSVLHALADPTRRAVLEQILNANEINVADLTRASGVTQGAVSQHLKTLKHAGLVVERPEGRRVYYRARSAGLKPLFNWLKHYEAFWRIRLDNLRDLLKEIDT